MDQFVDLLCAASEKAGSFGRKQCDFVNVHYTILPFVIYSYVSLMKWFFNPPSEMGRME